MLVHPCGRFDTFFDLHGSIFLVSSSDLAAIVLLEILSNLFSEPMNTAISIKNVPSLGLLQVSCYCGIAAPSLIFHVHGCLE